MALLVTLYHHLFQPSISENDASQKAANDLTRFVPGMLSGIVLFLSFIHVVFIIPPPQNVGGGLYWIRFVASVGRSVGRSVPLQFLSAL